MSNQRGATVEVRCACGTMFTARVADRKRGWAKSCSKSCAARKSNAETGKYQKLMHGGKSAFDSRGLGTDGYYHEHQFSNAHQFSNEEHDCNKD